MHFVRALWNFILISENEKTVNLPDEGSSAVHSKTEETNASGEQDVFPLLSFRDAGYCYDKKTPFENRALEHINLSIGRGTSTAVFGSSGSGKTTLLEIAAGITAPTEGLFEL